MPLCEKHVRRNPRGPHVNWKTVPGSRRQSVLLWSHESWCATFLLQLFVPGQNTSDPKIGKLQLGISAMPFQHKIVWLEISMADAFSMHVRNGMKHLCHVDGNFCFLDLPGSLLNLIAEVSPFTILQHDIVVLFVFECLKDLGDVRVAARLHGLDLKDQVLIPQPSLGHSPLFNGLHCSNRTVLPMDGSPDHPKRSRSQPNLLHMVHILDSLGTGPRN
mmetsp:Transcript_64284/g.172068  ORF Transcript_64284/g.172068 Transcript_64284/m.172068 type:complete len:218 (+) Transcript_64284:1513-2166(+)